MPQILRMLAEAVVGDADFLPSIPSAIIVLPRDDSTGFSPAPAVPLAQYYPEGGEAGKHQWNPGGAKLLELPLPCGVFLAPKREAQSIKARAKENSRRVRPCWCMHAHHTPRCLCMWGGWPGRHGAVQCLHACMGQGLHAWEALRRAARRPRPCCRWLRGRSREPACG